MSDRKWAYNEPAGIRKIEFNKRYGKSVNRVDQQTVIVIMLFVIAGLLALIAYQGSSSTCTGQQGYDICQAR